ncbi:MAG: class I SAM-dependent methyltransferase [Ignavibacterium sp.]|jgi:cyclopropane fatty-acyl-phospholipid synthase-like methyltransferase|nr:class I SAM-dependent methyltransferase [Ignavibacterium sp.]
MKSEWFKDWFNTKEYLNVYQHRNEKDAEEHIKLILDNIKIPSRSKILDMACGAGRHAVILARKDFEVTAVDLSENLLLIARQSAKDENLKINFIRSDIREFKTDEKFNLIINLFTSFGYFDSDEENFSVLQKAYDLLADDGFFVLDFFNSHFLQKNLIESSEEIMDEVKIHQFRKIKENRVRKKIVITKDGNLSQFEESVRMFTKEELTKAIKNIGFDIYKTFGDFLGNNFEQFTSPRLIMICKK